MQTNKIFGNFFGLKAISLTLAGFFVLFAAIASNVSGQTERLFFQEHKPFELFAGLKEEPEEGPPEFIFSSNLITASTYGFLTSNAVLEDMSSGTTQLVGPGVDDTASPVTNIGFDFWYDGVRHSQFSINANGLARLGSVVVGTTFNNSTSGLNTVTNAPKIAPYFEDLCVGTNGKVHFKTVGSAPNRKLIVEWTGMQVTRGSGCAGEGTGTFQMWLFESAGTTTPGLIQFVYGAGIGPSATADAGASIGLQSGVATNFASVTASTDTVSYDTHDPLNAAGLPAGKSYLFTPTNLPAAPTGLTFAPVTGTSIQLNWTDNATNEVGYAIYRSTDGTNFTFISQTAADATSFNDTGLVPGTTYFYQVYAAAEGALSSTLPGSQTTNPPGNDTCNGAGGNWSETTTWADGSVPTVSDNVTIGSGCSVTVDVTTAVAFNVTINSGGTLQSPLTGTVTNNNLTVGGNVTNNGTLDFSTNGDTSGAILTFGATIPNVTFGGSGVTTDVRAITVAKGAQENTVELTTSNFTVQGVNTDSAGFLTLTSGTFKISGTFTATNRVFTTAGYTIPALGGLWLNNPNFTVAGQNGSPTVTGLLRLTTGTYNVGTSTGNSLGGGTGGQFIIEGGVLNATGRLQTTSAVSYTQSGGTVNVCTIGNTATTACFGLTSASNTFNMTGGSIVLVLPNTNATPLDYSVSSVSSFVANPAGTTLQIGNGSTPPASTFRVLGNTPNILISSGQTMNVGSGTAGGVIFFRGSTITNNGAIAVQGTGTSSRFDWAASGPMTYGGPGTFGTAGTTFAGVGMSANSPTGDNTTLNSPIFINRVNFFSGGFVNSNQITLGNGGTSTTVVQVGNSTTPTNAGTFDVSPIYNSGSGGHIVLHLRTTTLNRPTGFEINPTRTLASWTIDENAPGSTLNVVGGDITIVGSLAFTNGVVTTGSNTIIHNGAATRTNGFVDGNLRRNFTATGAYTYHVGQNGYSPVLATVTALGTNPSSLTVSPNDSTLPGLNASSSASRFWSLTEAGDLTANLAFTYLDADVNGNEADYRVFRLSGGVLTNQCPGGPCVNEATNTATVTGITDFSDWGIGEAGAAVAGELAFNSATYSIDEDAGTATITVNRTGGSAGTVTVDYATVAGGTATGGATCTAGVDYINASGTLTFVNGDTTETFAVTVCPDADVEGNETVNLALSNPTGGATLGALNTAVLTIVDVVAPLGNVVVNPGNIAYMTLGEAVAAINAGTHTGAVTVDIFANTTETGSIVLNSSGAGAASYTSVVISPKADGVTVAGPSVQGRGLIELNGADNVTIDGDNPNTAGTNRNLTIQNTAANTTTFTSVIRIAMNTTTVNSADNNILRNLNIVGSSTGQNISTATTTTGPQNTTFGIFSGPNASGPETAPNALTSVLTGVAAGATASNLIVSNNSVVTAARAISINGSATSVHTGLQVRDNSIGNSVAGDVDQVTAIGITANGATNPVITGNTVYVEGFIASSAATHGINVGVNSTNTTGATIEKNRVNRVQNNNPGTWSAFGINVAGIAASAHRVQNNFVSGVINSQVAGTGGFGTTFGAYGIRVASGTNHQIYHNSVNLYGAMPGTVSTNLTAAFLVVGTGQTGLDVRNNIFVNTISGGNPASPGTRNVAIYVPSGATSAMNLTLNNNDYFVGSDAQNRMAQRGTTFGTGEYTLADFDPNDTANPLNFRNYSSTLSAAGTNDNASKKVDPQFVSNTDLHILPTSLAESGGANVDVTDDIDGDLRPAVPDIGADEISVAGPGTIQFSSVSYNVNEGGTATINVIRSGGTDGTVGATATITDGTATGGAACTAGVDYINPGPQVLTFGDGVSLQSFMIQTCSDVTLKANETVILTLSNPTGGATIGANNPATLTIVDVPPPFSGTVNVGTGEIFTSLTNPGGIFEAINEAGLSNNLTVNITSDLTAETGTVPLNQFTETGAGGYTLTFKPSGAPRTISGTSAINTGLINLNGADRVIFDGSLSGGTDRSLTIINSQTGTSTVIWIRSANASDGANDNTIKNSIIHGVTAATAQTTAGILAGSGTTIGGPAAAPNNNNTVTNNHIYSVQNSIFSQGNVGFDQNWMITDNEFGSTVEANKNRFRGMLIGNAQNFVISGNTINGVLSFGTTTAAMSGIQLAFTLNGGSIVNNTISDIKNTSTTGTGAFGMQQTSTSAAANVLIANNFIYDVAAVGSATLPNNGHGINFNGVGAGGYRIYHNSINMNTNQSSGTTSAMLVRAAGAGGLDIRNNIFANTQTSGATRYSFYSEAAATVYAAINFNNYFSSQNVGFLGGVRVTLSDWQTATGQDANSLAVDPLFVSATDLHLQAGSPMINAGTPLAEVTTDIDGDPRSATTPDIGADEFSTVGQPGTLQFSSATYSVGEGGGTVTLTVNRTGGTTGAVTVDYSLGGGTATGGASCGGSVDYVNTGGTVSFANGETSKAFNVTICDDAFVEADETFDATLSNATGGATIGVPNPATVTIIDNDVPAGTFSVNDVRVFEGNAGTTNAVFTVTYTGSGAGSVNFATSNGTATAGADYFAANGVLNFASAGTQMISVVIISDTVIEANETFFLNLSNPVNGTITDGQGVGIIIDDDRSYVSDFDNDKISDYSVYRPSTGDWYALRTSNGVPYIVNLGIAGDIAVPGDYDGDGFADRAIFRPSEGTWYVVLATTEVLVVQQWGTNGDIPVQGDYDGDGKTDFGVFRPSDGTWYILGSSNGPIVRQFGLAGDIPVAGDFDGDAKNDLAVYRDGFWYILRSSNQTVSTTKWGNATDIPISGDFDGDGSFDLTIYRNGQWWILDSLTGQSRVVNLGLATDIPAPADYDGDGTSDITVFRPSTGEWFTFRSSDGVLSGPNWGTAGDVPVAKAYTP